MTQTETTPAAARSDAAIDVQQLHKYFGKNEVRSSANAASHSPRSPTQSGTTNFASHAHDW